MEKQVGSIVTSVFLALTFGCWLTAMVAPGWFLFEFKTSSSSFSLTNASLGQSSEKNFMITAEVDMGLFFIRVCINDVCEQIDYEKLKSIQSHQAMPELRELQLESVLALALCTISGLLVMIPARSKSSKYRVALSLMSTAGNTLKYVYLYFLILKKWRSLRLYLPYKNTESVQKLCHLSFFLFFFKRQYSLVLYIHMTFSLTNKPIHIMFHIVSFLIHFNNFCFRN